MLSQKLYCYIDETGQDTAGKIFVVGVLIVKNKEQVIKWADNLDKIKKAYKWHRTRKKNKIFFLEALTKTSFPFQAVVTIFHDRKDYFQSTLEGIKEALISLKKNKLFLYLDGDIIRRIRLNIGVGLRHQGISPKKVLALSDKKSPVLRVIDAIVGAVREMEEGQKEITEKLEILIKNDKLKVFYK